MSWIRRHRPSPGMAIGIAALLVVLGGVAFAAIPDSDGTIHACYQKRNGNLRVVESSDDCRRSRELSLEWNQRGPKGDPGQAPVAYARVDSRGGPDTTDPTTFDHNKNVIGVTQATADTGYDCFDLTAPAINLQITPSVDGGAAFMRGDVPPNTSPCAAPFDDATVKANVNSYFVLFQLTPTP
jgi:hypothetical protein